MTAPKIMFSYAIQRYMSTSSVTMRNYLPRQGKFMSKMIFGGSKKKKWYAEKQTKPHQPFAPSASKVINPHVARRVKVLNTIFMGYITDIMATSTMSSEILGRGVEVSRVIISNDFRLVRVFWFTSEKDAALQDETAKLLENYAYKLRHELSQLRVIGVVPPILFVKDKQLGGTMSLENLMLEADYGEDYTPTITVAPPTPTLTLYSKLPEEIRTKVLEINKTDLNCTDDFDENDEIYDPKLPPMKHDVLGLNHSAIMNSIKQSLSKTQAAKNRVISFFPSPEQRPFDPKNIRPLRTEEEARAFSEFLLKRQIEEKKRAKWENQNLDTELFENRDDNEDDYENEPNYEDIDYNNFDDIESKELR